MQVTSYSHLRKNMKSYLDNVSNNREPLIVTRKNNQNYVLLSLEDYNSEMETKYIKSSSANAKRLEESAKQSKNGEVIIKKLL